MAVDLRERFRNLKAMVAFGAAVLATFTMMPEGRAQSQNPGPPPLSAAKAQFFKDNPAAWSRFLSQLPRPPAGAPQATPQPISPPFGGKWAAVTTAPVSGLSNPLLLTDGTVIVAVADTPAWYKLTPDITGSYVNGTWSRIASLPIINGTQYGPLYHASAVLPDGRVIIQGGEYNVSCSNGKETWTSLGAIYDPVANTWTAVSPPRGKGWTNTDTLCSDKANGGIGDAQSIVLPDGVFLLAACCANPAVDALFNATTLAYASTRAPSDPCVPCGGGTYQDEQGYTLLPGGNVLTIDVWDPPNAQQYTPATRVWTRIAPTPVSLIDPTACGNFEIGPAVTRPDGTVVAFGGNTGCTGQPDPTAIYQSSKNTWIQGPNVPAACGSGGTTNCTLADAPAAMLPSGNILFAASAGAYHSPTHFFEFTSANTIEQVADTHDFAGSSSSYFYNFLVLPTGQILETDFSDIAEVYTPTGTPNRSWAPTISSIPRTLSPGHSYKIAGTQLNGLSQGAAYGDDVQGATNFPIVAIRNNVTRHVFFAKTFGFSTLSIAPGARSTASFIVAADTETGASSLYVLANGISSAELGVTIAR
jgi:hypothetical protein